MRQAFEAAAEVLARDLAAALGDNLVSLMLYGSAARGGWVEGRSDVNALLVLRDASAPALNQAAPALRAWVKVARAAPLIQSETDWKASADVFPIEIEDIRDAHRLLAGRDVLPDVTTTPADLRRQLEQEARGKLIRLRAAYAATAGEGQALAELLARAFPVFVVLFRGALRLAGRPVPAEADAVVRGAAALAGFDATAFDWVLAARRGAKTPALQPFDSTAARFLDAVQTFVTWVDQT